VVLDFAIPTFNKESAHYVVRVISDSWVGVEEHLPVSYEENKKVSRLRETVTELQDLTPLPVSALQETRYEQLYRFETFNPVSAQFYEGELCAVLRQEFSNKMRCNTDTDAALPRPLPFRLSCLTWRSHWFWEDNRGGACDSTHEAPVAPWSLCLHCTTESPCP
jgi:hypothetical protein